MILCTHAIVGGAIASFIPTHPALAVVAGFASHFAIDAIPHWDYPLLSISIGKTVDNQRMRLSRGLFADLVFIGTDAVIGFGLSMWLFATPATAWTIGLGAAAGMLPDPLQFAYSVYPREPLRTLQSFHKWIHTKRRLAWKLGVSSQIAFASAVTAFAVALN
jgi:hypothetical protein